MRSKLPYFWDDLRTSFWFVPTLMALLAIGLAFGMVALDKAIKDQVEASWGWTYTGGPEGARAVLAAIAGSMITVAGTVFSIVIVALSLASGQFGPRLLRNFIRDRSNQFVLGTFTATFTYSLLVLRTVRGTDADQFVPAIGVAVGIVMAMASLGVLIYFIHHVAVFIQADHVIAAVSDELNDAIDTLWPDELGHEPPEPPAASALPEGFEKEAVPVAAPGSGYLAAIDHDELLGLARRHDLVVRVAHRPGHFVVRGSKLASVWPEDRLEDGLRAQLVGAFLLEPQRTAFQDVEFSVDQLVEIAVRALSPGINDPFTAVACIDRLGEALCRLAGRSVPSAFRHDEESRLRVVARPVTFGEVADAALNQIRQYGRTSVAVLIRLLASLTELAEQVRRDEDRAVLEHHADLVLEAARQALPQEMDRTAVERRHAVFLVALRKETKSPTP